MMPPGGRGGALLLLLFAAASRKAEDVLALEVRRRIYQQVTRYPGLHLREVARNLDLQPNHAKYHLRYLETHGLVSSRREGGYWRFFPREQGSMGLRDALGREEKAMLALLRRPVPLHVAVLLADREQATHAELLDEVGVAHGTLHYHLQRMEQAGIVESCKAGRERFYNLRDREGVLKLLLAYRPPDALVEGFLAAWDQLELR